MPVSCLFSGVELASCQFHAYFRAWNWHLASFMLIFECGNGILPVSCLFLGGQDAHSTAIDSKTGKLAYSTGATRGEFNY
ncbi:hypothetical protein [Moorena sp. SIO3I8]|uniref:hypothetical protein n=1 Tax=Moorena sp. SIO3I8 TaxID=2607833 RepID=UPI0013C0430F|nr:hypothetical protein [Moorena sp. SIO3I8]NEO04966.1 hypothetical protein [Moorena sp. SIO3I8]